MTVSEPGEKWIWINGASRGIGQAIALRLAGEGYGLILSARSMESFNSINPEIRKSENIQFIECDISDPEKVNGAFNHIQSAVGCPDILINCAGVAAFKKFIDMDIDDFDSMVSVNLRGTFLCMKSVLPGMLARKSGLIINILSVAAIKTFTHSSVYAATKAGLLAMDRSVREEVRPMGIKITDIIPGATVTGIWDKPTLDSHGSRMMQGADIAEAVSMSILASMNGRAMIEEIVIRPQLGDI